VLDAPLGPEPALRYNQAGVAYMRGHAGIVITGADETTNVSVFSVGRANAVNQALFIADMTYDGVADIAFIAIASTNGKFGGVRTANASFFASRGYTGLYAPGVEFTGPVFIADISASDAAIPVLKVGSASDVRITGGNLAQANAHTLNVTGLTQVRFVAGSTSAGRILAAQANRARWVDEEGFDVTSRVVVNPTP
jgi:hypothetical protein